MSEGEREPSYIFFFQAEDGIRYLTVTGVQTCALPISLQMAEVCRLLQGKGDIVILVGELTNQAARQRTQDIYDVIARAPCRGIRVVEKQSANWKRTEAADLVTNWLSAGLRPQAVVANDDEMAIGAIQSLKQAKLLSRTIVAGIDATPDGLAAMKAGDLDRKSVV